MNLKKLFYIAFFIFSSTWFFLMIYFTTNTVTIFPEKLIREQRLINKIHGNIPESQPTFDLRNYDNFNEALDHFLIFQEQTRNWIIEQVYQIIESNTNQYQKVKDLRKKIKVVYYRAQGSGIANQLFTVASSVLLAMASGSIHLYDWNLPCSLEFVSPIDPNWGDMEKEEWKVTKILRLPIKSLISYFDTQQIQFGTLNSVSLRFSRPKQLCDQLEECKLSDSAAQLEHEVYIRMFSSFTNEMKQFMRDSPFIPHPIQPPPPHLEQIFQQVSFNYTNSIFGRGFDFSDNLPVIGMHLRLGDSNMMKDREAWRKRNKAIAKKKKKKKPGIFANWEIIAPPLFNCVANLISEYLFTKQYKKVIILLASDRPELKQEIQEYYSNTFGFNRVIVISSPGAARHSSIGSDECTNERRTAYLKLFTDIILMCRANVLFASKGSTLSTFMKHYCDPFGTRMIHFNSWDLPQKCNLPKNG
eukprot:gb/GECH01009652.1/.p1 GENE.gb/GECH01009652.1/~~gb/GECH01009652.1/.p1  ORF type:complete len:472 (+),score=99.37 gb/GECH01009652.1/:1-1416(+)